MIKVALTSRALKTLRPALGGSVGTIKREIANGVSALYQSVHSRLFIVVRPEGQQHVVVAVAGSGLYQSRIEIINFARFNQFTSIRFHTKHPERLTRALSGLAFSLVETRQSLFGRDELIYVMGL